MRRRLELSSKQQDKVSAALRHVRDAEHLMQAGPPRSLDQAFHLAGFGPECMRKALLQDGIFAKILGHRLAPDMEPTLEAILALEPGAHRYAPRHWGSRWPALATWTEQARYERTGTRVAAEVDMLVTQSAEAVRDTLAALWADGRLPTRFAW
jgi:hypothetical protein